MAQNRHAGAGATCPLLGVERKSEFEAGRSVDDPSQTSLRAVPSSENSSVVHSVHLI